MLRSAGPACVSSSCMRLALITPVLARHAAAPAAPGGWMPLALAVLARGSGGLPISTDAPLCLQRCQVQLTSTCTGVCMAGMRLHGIPIWEHSYSWRIGRLPSVAGCNKQPRMKRAPEPQGRRAGLQALRHAGPTTR